MTKIKIKYHNICTWLMILLIILLAFSFYNLWKLDKQLDEIESAKPKIKEMKVTFISAPDCDDCTDISSVADAIKQLPNIRVTEQQTLEFENAKELVEKYGIKRLPSVVLTGSIADLELPIFERVADALVLLQTPPPFYDVENEKIAGLVKITIIKDDTCAECHDLVGVIPQFSQVGVEITGQEVIDASEEKAKELIERYKITKIPTMIMNKEAQEYEILSPLWNEVGSVEEDEVLVLREAIPPFKDLETGKVRGLVKVTYLVDETCEACYNASIHKLVLQQNFALDVSEESTVDISSNRGKKIVQDYEIVLVPTVVVSSEAEVYRAFVKSWPELGTEEKDGNYVFRDIDKLGVVYKNLETGELVNNTKAAP